MTSVLSYDLAILPEGGAQEGLRVPSLIVFPFSDVEFENLLEAIRATTETKEISNLVSFYSRISAAAGSFGQLKQADYRRRDICNCRYYVISSTIRMNLTYHPKGHPAWHHPFHLLPFECVDEMT